MNGRLVKLTQQGMKTPSLPQHPSPCVQTHPTGCSPSSPEGWAPTGLK
jgi:hypothetical protein